MRNQTLRNKSIIVLAAAALAAAGFYLGTSWLPRAEARPLEAIEVWVTLAPLGMIEQQALRVCVANNLPIPPQTDSREGFADIIVGASAAAPDGSAPFEAADVRVPPRQWRCLADISHGDLNGDREPGTGRIQFGLNLAIRAPAGSQPSDFRASAEILDSSTGKTEARFELSLSSQFGTATAGGD